MLYHQKRLAQVNSGSSARAISQILGRWTSLFDWRQNLISHSSSKYQPLATMPCSSGHVPVTYVDCAVQFTAGSGGVTEAIAPLLAKALRRGVLAPRWSGVSPTALITTVLCIAPLTFP